MRSLSLRPEDSLPIPRMGLPMGFKVLVSRHPAIAATRLLTVASVGLPPTERVRLRWTHFRTAGFPQYGFKASLSARACPGRDEVKPTPGMPPSPAEFTPRLRAGTGDNLGTQPVRPEAGNPARSAPRTTPLTPGVLSSGRVVLSRPSSLIRPHAPVSGAPADFVGYATYTAGLRWAGAPEATPETFPTFAVGLSARAADHTPVGSPPPPVVLGRRYQASPSSTRVAPHNLASASHARREFVSTRHPSRDAAARAFAQPSGLAPTGGHSSRLPRYRVPPAFGPGRHRPRLGGRLHGRTGNLPWSGLPPD
jgi:hypothetical protein